MRTDLDPSALKQEVEATLETKEADIQLWSRHTNHPFPCLVSPKWSKRSRLASCEAMHILLLRPFVPRRRYRDGNQQNLLGTDVYRNGMTARCQDSNGLVYQVMMKETEVITSVGSTLVADIAPVDWDIARREVVCQEN